ncbi:hypothetical protein LCGC14_1851110, partial [marine sediment metagenome]
KRTDRAVLDWFMEHRGSSMREAMGGYRSTSTVWRALQRLRANGLITWEPGIARTYRTYGRVKDKGVVTGYITKDLEVYYI